METNDNATIKANRVRRQTSLDIDLYLAINKGDISKQAKRYFETYVKPHDQGQGVVTDNQNDEDEQ